MTLRKNTALCRPFDVWDPPFQDIDLSCDHKPYFLLSLGLHIGWTCSVQKKEFSKNYVGILIISTNDPWYIAAVLTGNLDFDAPNCQVRALRYYYRYMSEHSGLRKGRHRLFIPVKDNNAGKELSAVPLFPGASAPSLWIIMLRWTRAESPQNCQSSQKSVQWLPCS